MAVNSRSCPSCSAPIAVVAMMPGRQFHCPECGLIQSASQGGSDLPSWYYARGKQKIGPVTLAELQQLVAGGQLGPADMVLRVGASKWGPASAVPGVFGDPGDPAASATEPVPSAPTIDYCCPACQSSLQSPPADAGREVECPSCRQRLIVPVSESAGSSDAQQQAPDPGWGLYTRVRQAFFTPINELEQEAARGASLADPLAPWEPDRIGCVCSAALSAVTALELDASLPEAFRAALLRVEQHRSRLLGSLDPAAWELRAALQQVRGLNLPPGWLEGVLTEAARANDNPLSETGRVAIGGAFVGTCVLPGVGTVVGYALGALLSHAASREKDNGHQQATLARFNQAANAMMAAVRNLFVQVWDGIAQVLIPSGDSSVREAVFFAEAEQRWEALAASFRQRLTPEHAAWAWDEVMRFQGEWGPHPDALDTAARLCLPPYARDLDTAAAWADLQLRLFPSLPEGYENRAEVYLELGDFEGCYRLSHEGLRISPGYERLVLLQIESLAGLGRMGDARALVASRCDAGAGGEAWLRYVRGLYHSGRLAEAAEAAREWAVGTTIVHGVAYSIRMDPVMGHDLAFLAHLPEFAQAMQAPDWELRGIVETMLDADGARSFRGNLTAERLATIRAAFPSLAPGERVLYFLDGSRWYGSGGLVITTSRALWKSAWREPVAMHLAGLSPEQVGAEGGVLKLNGQAMDLKEPVLAANLAAALLELAGAVRRLTGAVAPPELSV